MTSEMAREDIEQMWADGLHPTVADIIRLNALGLKCERAKARHAGDEIYIMPRVAILRDGIYFRQPTIGHEIWLDAVAQHSSGDYQTAFALDAFALSRPPDDLPDPHNANAVKEAVEAFLATLSPFTEAQVLAALRYVQNGLSNESGEYPPMPPSADDADADREDWEECVSLGVLRNSLAILTGLTVADARRMTRDELDMMRRRALMLHGVDVAGKGDYELGNYYHARQEIIARITPNQTPKPLNH